MVPKRCLDCGTHARPRLVHPSTLRTEVSVWLVALTVGAGAGLWSVVSTPPETPESSAIQRVALTVMAGAEAPPPVTAGPNLVGRNGSGWPVVFWIKDLVLDFLRTAWWVLPIPVAFSLWRQFAQREGCIECGSRRFDPLPAPPETP